MTAITRKLGKSFGWVGPCLMAGALNAAQLSLPPSAELTFEDLTDSDRYDLPLAPWADGRLPVEALTGQVLRQAWRVPGAGFSPSQTAAQLMAQLEAQGYRILFDCSDRSCGGFDFRFDTEVLSAPEMYVDLTDFHFISAADADMESFLSLMVSKAARAGYVQVIDVVIGALPMAQVSPEPQTESLTSQAGTGGLAGALQRNGSVILPGLAFEAGASALGDGQVPALAELAAFLAEDATRRVVLVGHTDAVGALDANIVLSRRRAQSVLERLTSVYGVSGSQLSAEGAGYLAPIAPNDTAEGQDRNRRVEAVLLPSR
ncbi:OmpA family protein [Pseudoprimorskyibacter insulae]|uniref:Outer membrane porin F n=1 Tax=Pseudoprimorskyibacter insulae TaxID=1695997 RepID=A0A2R8ANB1_9RHOB|nr:OmpA family protein [Pseudoprimorskyibacter insulae]SPF77533.1 Outer membrane porin F [Pseudoprimorskyibacter insulae]